MSVIVNMETPQNCKDCMDSGLSVAVSVFGAMCPFCEKVFVVDFNINIEKQRLKDCPLIELPPHGDLVDLNDMVHPNDSMRRMTIDEQLRRTCEGWSAEKKNYVVIEAEDVT